VPGMFPSLADPIATAATVEPAGEVTPRRRIGTAPAVHAAVTGLHSAMLALVMASRVATPLRAVFTRARRKPRAHAASEPSGRCAMRADRSPCQESRPSSRWRVKRKLCERAVAR
jgi:hypothetical protein